MKILNILIIDDNQDLTDGLGAVLEAEDYQVSLAYTGVDGIKTFDSGVFDLVFIDIKLPDMSGIEVFWNLHKKSPKTKIVMMTGYRVEQLLAEVVDNGDIEILRMPFELKHALEIIVQIKKESIVLVADVDSDFSENLSAYLNEHGVKTMLARNGEEAINGILSNPVDVLVLDLHTPIMCGLEIYQELKQRDRIVKTIMVIGYSSEEKETDDILKIPSVTGCLFKPFNPGDMLHFIEQGMDR